MSRSSRCAPGGRRSDLATRIEHELDSRSVAVAAWLYRRTGGRIARLYDRDVLLLTTTGRRTGRQRTVPLQYFPSGDDLVVVAANSGLPSHPAWYLNLSAGPGAVAEVGSEALEVTAEVMSDEEAERFWPTVLDRAPDYARYRSRTDRTIPLVRLRRVGPTDDRPEPRARPLAVTTSVALLGFTGATAMAGGIEMMAAPHGNVFVAGEWLDDIPLVSTYRLPGLALATLGAASVATAHGLRQRPEVPLLTAVEARTGHHWSWAATGAVGAALVTWIAAEVAVVPERSAIEALYGLVGLGLVASCALPRLRRHTSLATSPTPRASDPVSVSAPRPDPAPRTTTPGTRPC